MTSSSQRHSPGNYNCARRTVKTLPGHGGGAIRIGISGWRYPPWRGGAFYPKGLPQRRELEYASRALPSIEINGSFYSLQRPESYAAWRDQTPADFVFSVKGGRYITHMLRLSNVEKALANFFASGVANLDGKLGPFLWQLPPTLKYDRMLVDDFLSLLPRDSDQASVLARRHDDKLKSRARIAFGPNRPLRHALEVRHQSFVNPSLITMLRRHRVAFVIADTAGKWPEFEDVTADFVYIRLHGEEELYRSAYMEAALTRWAKRIRLWSRGEEPSDACRISGESAPRTGTRDVYCYFDNTDKVEAPANALHLIQKLGVAWEAEPRLKRRA
ncbi:MAG: DUF72 domain-containing protein [Betaproteobacteria bacterium]|nr:MAG: DUF72 domain-containing protein [Betaproteobacteria bacterium]TMH03319.1 MAG: DUF72 domain-containing protein [Betaproteobacteria bacterium]